MRVGHGAGAEVERMKAIAAERLRGVPVALHAAAIARTASVGGAVNRPGIRGG